MGERRKRRGESKGKKSKGKKKPSYHFLLVIPKWNQEALQVISSDCVKSTRINGFNNKATTEATVLVGASPAQPSVLPWSSPTFPGAIKLFRDLKECSESPLLIHGRNSWPSASQHKLLSTTLLSVIRWDPSCKQHS